MATIQSKEQQDLARKLIKLQKSGDKLEFWQRNIINIYKRNQLRKRTKELKELGLKK